MTIANASPRLYNEDLAPARERNWGAFSIFNVWTSDVHSLWGYYLAASLFLICGNFVNFIVAIGIGSLVIFLLMNLVGLRWRQDRSSLPRSRSGVVRNLWRQFAGAGPRGGCLLLVWRANERRLRRHRRSSPAQQRDRRIQPEFAFPRSHDPGDDHLHHRVGAPAPHHSARNGDGAAVPGLGGSGGVGDDADPRHLPLRARPAGSRSATTFRATC